MEQDQLSLSEEPASSLPQEMNMDFMDQHGVLRRSNSVTERGATFLMKSDITDEGDKPHSSAEVELSRIPLKPVIRSMTEADMDTPMPHEERMRRRTQFQLQLRDRKHSILVEQNTHVQERLQLWHDAIELDPAVETTSQNTAQTPSPRSQTYVDEDGNLRRKSSLSPFTTPSTDLTLEAATSAGLVSTSQEEASAKTPRSPASLLFGPGKLSPRIRTALVLEFAQTFIDS